MLNFARAVRGLTPPLFEIDPDLAWALRAAFAAEGPRDLRPRSPERVLELIGLFDLVTQVAARQSPTQLDLALGQALCARLLTQAQRRVMHNLAAIRIRDRVCQIALESNVDVCLLKQAAMDALRLVTPTQRYAADVDLLVSPADRSGLSDALLRTGFRLVTDRTHQHGVVVVRDPDGIGVELHTRLIDVALPSASESAVDIAALRRHGLVQQLAAPNPRVFVPNPALLAAHLVVQGWYLFHFAPNAPHHKSTFRVVADLLLLGVHRDDLLAQQVRDLVKDEVPEPEFLALVELARCLERGIWDDSAIAGIALRHAVAAKIDRNYRYGLLWERQFDAMQREGIVSWSTRNLRRAFLPLSGEVDGLIRGGKGRTQLRARLRIAWKLVSDGLNGAWASLIRRSK